jgi:predicted regulator of Ras-like GTPase activity (Roadblock/LC7/MglB family)
MGSYGMTSTGQELSWLLDDLAARVDDIQHAVILSRDGLAVAASQNLGREHAEHLAALAAGVQSLARGAGEHFSLGDVRQTIIELEQAFLFVTAAGYGSCLAVMCPSTADAGLVAYEMAMLVKRAGPHLVAQPRMTGPQIPAE